MIDERRKYDRLMLRSAFQSLFWSVLLTRKHDQGLTRTGLAEKLGIHKSFVTRAFSKPPNWQVDKISDMADALGVDLILEARDRATGAIYTPSGVRHRPTTSSNIDRVQTMGSGPQTKTPPGLVVVA